VTDQDEAARGPSDPEPWVTEPARGGSVAPIPEGGPGALSLADDFDGEVSPIWHRGSIEPNSLAFVAPSSDRPHPALAITVRPGQVAMVGGDGRPTERAEPSQAPRHWVPFETEVWYGFSLCFPPEFPVVDTGPPSP